MTNLKIAFRQFLLNHCFWKEFLYSLVLNIIVSTAFVSILYYNKKRSVWDALSIISLIILLISFLSFLYSLKKWKSPIKKVKKLFVLKESDNLKLTKTEKALMNILDDDLKADKDYEKTKKLNSAWLWFYSLIIASIVLIISIIVLFT